jgi:hypothetical protein
VLGPSSRRSSNHLGRARGTRRRQADLPVEAVRPEVEDVHVAGRVDVLLHPVAQGSGHVLGVPGQDQETRCDGRRINGKVVVGRVLEGEPAELEPGQDAVVTERPEAVAALERVGALEADPDGARCGVGIQVRAAPQVVRLVRQCREDEGRLPAREHRRPDDEDRLAHRPARVVRRHDVDPGRPAARVDRVRQRPVRTGSSIQGVERPQRPVVVAVADGRPQDDLATRRHGRVQSFDRVRVLAGRRGHVERELLARGHGHGAGVQLDPAGKRNRDATVDPFARVQLGPARRDGRLTARRPARWGGQADAERRHPRRRTVRRREARCGTSGPPPIDRENDDQPDRHEGDHGQERSARMAHRHPQRSSHAGRSCWTRIVRPPRRAPGSADGRGPRPDHRPTGSAGCPGRTGTAHGDNAARSIAKFPTMTTGEQ